MYTKDELGKIESMTGFIKVAWYFKEAEQKWKKDLDWVSNCQRMLNKPENEERIGEEDLEKIINLALTTSRTNAIENYCFVAELMNIIINRSLDKKPDYIKGVYLYHLKELKDAGEIGNVYRDALRVLVTDMWGKQIWENITYFNI